MRNFVIAISILWMFLGGITSPYASKEYKELKEDNEYMANKILELRDSVQCYKEDIEYLLVPENLAIYLQEEKERKIRREERLKGTLFTLKRGVILDIDTKLYSALLDYNGPKGLITSNKRYWNTYSKHRKGKAIDLRWNWNIIRYLSTEEGQEWINKYGLKVYIERITFPSYLKKQIPEILYDNLFRNRKATAPHIHIQL